MAYVKIFTFIVAIYAASASTDGITGKPTLDINHKISQFLESVQNGKRRRPLHLVNRVLPNPQSTMGGFPRPQEDMNDIEVFPNGRLKHHRNALRRIEELPYPMQEIDGSHNPLRRVKRTMNPLVRIKESQHSQHGTDVHNPKQGKKGSHKPQQVMNSLHNSEVRRILRRKEKVAVHNTPPMLPANSDKDQFINLRIPNKMFCAKMMMHPTDQYFILPWWYHHCQRLDEKNSKNYKNDIFNLPMYKRVLDQLQNHKKIDARLI